MSLQSPSFRRAPLVVVSGTGTSIGKTHVACALVRAGAPARARGVKPIESGVDGDEGDDGRALRLASHPTFHVKHPPAPYLLRRAVSPHLAARDEGRRLDLATVRAFVEGARHGCDVLFVELAGGLFSPLAPPETNAELASALAPDALLLVAPDRLGVLHDVGASLRAARGVGLRITAVALVAPATADASTGTNAAELRAAGGPPVFEVQRADVDALSRSADVRALYAALVA